MERSQIRCILLKEGVRWRHPRKWAESTDPEFVPKERGSSPAPPTRQRGTTILCLDELKPVSPRTFPRHRAGLPMAIASKPPLTQVVVPTRCGSTERGVPVIVRLSRNTAGFQALLDAVDQANPGGDRSLIADNLSSHKRAPIQKWLVERPRMHIEPLPTGPAGSISLKAGGGSFDGMPSPARALPTIRSLQRSPGSRPASSTVTPSRGSGGVHPVPIVSSAVAWCTRFEEWSTSISGDAGDELPPRRFQATGTGNLHAAMVLPWPFEPFTEARLGAILLTTYTRWQGCPSGGKCEVR